MTGDFDVFNVRSIIYRVTYRQNFKSISKEKTPMSIYDFQF